MTIYSMTGYASASSDASESGAGAGGARVAVHVELRSVNSRFLDLAFRLPDELRGIEPALRELISQQFRRGKIELHASTAADAATSLPQPTPELVNRLVRIESSVLGWLPQARPLSVNEVLNWCRSQAAPVRADEAVLAAARAAVEGLRDARAREGERPADDAEFRLRLSP